MESEVGLRERKRQRTRQLISDAGGDVTVYDYAGTEHAFFNDDRPEVYHEAAASLSWDRTLTFLHDKLGSS